MVVLCWSLYWLWLGVHPDVDWDGNAYDDPNSREFKKKLQPLAGGFYALLWVIRGDLDYYAKWLGLPAHNARSAANPSHLEREIF